MKVLQVDGNVGLGETGHEERKKGWWINEMGGMTALGLLRSCGWWGRVLAMVQAREFLQHQNFLQIWHLLWRSNLWEVKFLNHVSWGVFSWKYHFSRNHIFFCRVVFMAHLQVAVLCYLPSWAEIDSFSQGFYHRGFSPWSESQQKLWSGRRILLLLHARRQKWKDAKKWIKYHISHFQLSKIILFIRFSSSSGGIFTRTVWETSYFSLPVSEFPEMMVHLTVPFVAKWADKTHARYLRYQRSSPKW